MPLTVGRVEPRGFSSTLIKLLYPLPGRSPDHALDPYALSIEEDPWFIECNNLVVGYFQLVIDSIRDNDLRTTSRLLLNLHEPNDTHLGYSEGRPAGRGIGNRQANDLYRRLRTSEAAQTGRLRPGRLRTDNTWYR